MDDPPVTQAEVGRVSGVTGRGGRAQPCLEPTFATCRSRRHRFRGNRLPAGKIQAGGVQATDRAGGAVHLHPLAVLERVHQPRHPHDARQADLPRHDGGVAEQAAALHQQAPLPAGRGASSPDRCAPHQDTARADPRPRAARGPPAREPRTTPGAAARRRSTRRGGPRRLDGGRASAGRAERLEAVRRRGHAFVAANSPRGAAPAPQIGRWRRCLPAPRRSPPASDRKHRGRRPAGPSRQPRPIAGRCAAPAPNTRVRSKRRFSRSRTRGRACRSTRERAAGAERRRSSPQRIASASARIAPVFRVAPAARRA